MNRRRTILSLKKSPEATGSNRSVDSSKVTTVAGRTEVLAVRKSGGRSFTSDNAAGVRKLRMELDRERAKRKHTEEELQWYGSVVSDSTDVIAFFDQNCTNLSANDSFVKAFGMSKSELIGLNAAEIFGADFFAETIEPNAERCLNGEEIRYNGWFEFPVQGNRFMEIALRPFKGIADETSGFVLIGRDITERIRSQEELKDISHKLGKRVKELNCLHSVSLLIQDAGMSVELVLHKIVNIIPPSCQFPRSTCARVSFQQNEFRTTVFEESQWLLSSDIIVFGKREGSLEVYCIKEQAESDEVPFLAEEQHLIDTLATAIGQYLERVQTDQDLRESNRIIAAERQALNESNIALKEVLATIESEKKEGLLRVQSSIDRIVLPLLRRLETGAGQEQSRYLKLVRDNLAQVTSPFVGKLETRFAQLSPREVEICQMVKDGLSSKEIAATLNTSEGTVRNQRKSIRKKFGIANDQINLASFLKTV